MSPLCVPFFLLFLSASAAVTSETPLNSGTKFQVRTVYRWHQRGDTSLADKDTTGDLEGLVVHSRTMGGVMKIVCKHGMEACDFPLWQWENAVVSKISVQADGDYGPYQQFTNCQEAAKVDNQGGKSRQTEKSQSQRLRARSPATPAIWELRRSLLGEANGLLLSPQTEENASVMRSPSSSFPEAADNLNKTNSRIPSSSANSVTQVAGEIWRGEEKEEEDPFRVGLQNHSICAGTEGKMSGEWLSFPKESECVDGQAEDHPHLHLPQESTTMPCHWRDAIVEKTIDRLCLRSIFFDYFGADPETLTPDLGCVSDCTQLRGEKEVEEIWERAFRECEDIRGA